MTYITLLGASQEGASCVASVLAHLLVQDDAAAALDLIGCG